MQRIVCFAALACAIHTSHAAENSHDAAQVMASGGALLVRAAQTRAPDVVNVRPDGDATRGNKAIAIHSPVRDTAISVALARAWKIGFVEEGIEETRNMLLECQQEKSVVLTMPFQRSDSQQAHCFRF